VNNSANPNQDSPIKLDGDVPVRLLRGKIDRVYPEEWTADVSSLFDRRYFQRVPVMTPYLHPTNGAGFFAQPEEGAICVLAVPGDTSSPFVIGFLPGLRSIPSGQAVSTGVASEERVDEGKAGRDRVPGPDFSSNRAPTEGGGQVWRSVSDTEIRHHAGGVLEARAGKLARLLFFIDGTIIQSFLGKRTLWPGGASLLAAETKDSGQRGVSSQQMQRVFEQSKGADLRFGCGKVPFPLPEPPAPLGATEQLAAEGIGSEPIVWEVAASPEAFSDDALATNPSDAAKRSYFRMFLDRAGNLMVRLARSLVIRAFKSLRIKASDLVVIEAKQIQLLASEGASFGTSGGTTRIKGDVVELASGNRGVAAVGDNLLVNIPPGVGLTGILGGQPWKAVVEPPGIPIPATITTGSAVVRVP